MKSALTIFVLVYATAMLSGCGSNTNCSDIPIAVTPSSGTANHTSASPGNQVKFSVIFPKVPSGCALPAVVPLADWTVSDTTDVQISSAKDGTNGTATCINATTGPVTVTASYNGKTATAQLTCQ